MTEKLYPTILPTAPSMSYQESFHIITVKKYYQEILDLKDKYQNKILKYEKKYNKIINSSTAANTTGIFLGTGAILHLHSQLLDYLLE